MVDKEDASVEELTTRAAAMQLSSADSPSPPPATSQPLRRSSELQLQLPNPCELDLNDLSMPSARPQRDMEDSTSKDGEKDNIGAVLALFYPSQFAGRTIHDRRIFMQECGTYMTAWGLPVGVCIESKTKRMIARYQFNLPPGVISKFQWIIYFKQAREPSHVDYATVDEAMKEFAWKRGGRSLRAA
ncbi:hypothetical protein PHMEG_0009906 [Phytophthora megakarya]|uniref:Uncharacterized protein n=1 Tax=Phytophthora megakarya TaxID=4795 RepID=A0A225WF09_9STRA|nr:hypothetical protein PHMEG_0009906 [Phytophthora megakarya]